MEENKICFLTSARRHDDTRIYYREAVCLRRAGYDVTIICPDCQTTDALGIRFKVVEVSRRSHLLKTVTSPFKVLGRAIDENASVYHFHDPELILTGFFLKLFGKKVIYDVHEDTPRVILTKKWIPSFLRGVCSVGFELFETLFSHAFDGIVAVNDIVARRFPKKKTISVGNYPSVTEFPSVIPDFEQREPLACLIGTIQEDRGIFTVLESTRYMKWEVAVTGEYASKKIKEQVEEQNREGRLRYLGFLERDQVVGILLKARVGLAPMHPAQHYQLALPPKVFEYMMCEVPIVASDFADWRDVLENGDYGQCGICVSPEDPKAIAKAVNYLMENEEEAMQMGLNGRKAVLGHYNWERESQKLLRLYRKLLPLTPQGGNLE